MTEDTVQYEEQIVVSLVKPNNFEIQYIFSGCECTWQKRDEIIVGPDEDKA